MMRARVALFLFLLAAVVRADDGHDAHLYAGAQHFQAGRYTEALVEFRVAERLASDLGPSWYVAATLVKLKRPEEAITAFARAESKDPADRDGLFDYYHALACYDARLYHCADRLLATVGERAGPKIAGQARKVRGDLVPLLSKAAPPGALDWYHAHGLEALNGNQPALAAAYFEEAVEWAAARADTYRLGEARDGLARARAALVPAGPKP
jgi:tetratricopeptide (TPR) repeat protein